MFSFIFQILECYVSVAGICPLLNFERLGLFSVPPVFFVFLGKKRGKYRGKSCSITTAKVWNRFDFSCFSWGKKRIRNSTVQYMRVRYNAIQYKVQYSTVQYSTVQYSTVQYSKEPYSTAQYSTVQ